MSGFCFCGPPHTRFGSPKQRIYFDARPLFGFVERALRAVGRP